ncbi:uncharacterized protein GIQ15_03602 [Arthroderma uncinatum]|uniref:uncharacterized protein n=1 Tax=Arthroderma uncinatum TaxID=74035 RepID=UPI00144AF9C3|nr:uncharacterized protein GIQ15_03602 [Arthroderma uncinatum]KAF3484278.1 hypothetical protein GIQ15_03602 [Arthroderma uncinatum]
MSTDRWSKYMKGASAIFAYYISQGATVVVLTPPPPHKFNPSGRTNYQAIEEPILKGAFGGSAVSRIDMVHPTVRGAEDFSYQAWPADETYIWIADFGALAVKESRWRKARTVISLQVITGENGITLSQPTLQNTGVGDLAPDKGITCGKTPSLKNKERTKSKKQIKTGKANSAKTVPKKGVKEENLCATMKLHVSVDIHGHGNGTFLTSESNGDTLKTVLKSSSIPKVFFDVRRDSDALFAHFETQLSGAQDIQLMELATRTGPKKYVNGLSRCIERDGGLTSEEQRLGKSTKAKGLKLSLPKHGGSYEVFNPRPISPDIKAYCVQDVQYMPMLRKIIVPN